MDFFACFVGQLLVVYGFGWLLASLVGRSGLRCLLFAPLASYGFVGILCIIYKFIGIPATAVSVVFVPAALVAVLLLVMRASSHSGMTSKASAFGAHAKGRSEMTLTGVIPSNEHLAWLGVAFLYVAAGVLSTLWVFFGPMQSMQGLIQGYDGVYHLNMIQSMRGSGDLSSLSSGLYRAGASDYLLQSGASFYPSAWHDTVVLGMALFGCSNIVAGIDASVMLVMGVIVPLSVFAVVRRVVGEDWRSVAYGCFSPVVFAAFPLGSIVEGTMYPQILAFALVPLASELAMGGVAEMVGGALGPKAVVRWLFVAAAVIVTLGLVQPSAVFAVAVWVGSYTFFRILNSHVSHRVVKSLLFLGLCGALWIICYKLPFLQSLVHFQWDSFCTTEQAIANLYNLSPTQNYVAQPLLGAIVLFGAVAGMAHKRSRWLVVAMLFFALGYVATSSSEGTFKHLLSGFWYTDPVRMGGLVCLCAMPLAALTMKIASEALARVLACRGVSVLLVPLVGVFVVALIVMWPNYTQYGYGDETTAFGSWAYRLSRATAEDADTTLKKDEEEFGEQVKAIVGDSVVINVPDDGSSMLYGIDDIDVLWKRVSDTLPVLRHSLDQYADNPEVQEAVAETGARYVLQLDKGNDQAGMFHSYEADQWSGVQGIGPDTPGFTEILSKGDMHLYVINDVGDSSLDTAA